MENNTPTQPVQKGAITQEEFEKQLLIMRAFFTARYGISHNEYCVQMINMVKQEPLLLRCTLQSLLGSITYFNAIGLVPNTPEGYGFIDIKDNGKTVEATPILGYKGLVEIAYRNPAVKGIRIQSVYANDDFDYQYGTDEYINHKPKLNVKRGNLVAVYAIATIQGINPLFVVVHKEQLDEILKFNRRTISALAKYDVFNIMQAKVALKLLFKTLPKSGNKELLEALEADNKFDYNKGTKITVTPTGYQIIEQEEKKAGALQEVAMPEIILTTKNQ